jgi:cytochrome c553
LKKRTPWLKNLFFPPQDSKTFIRILPFMIVAFIVVALFAFANFAWEETNKVSFCGLTCHTMPPQYVTHQNSAHTNVTCEDCHMGRGSIYTLIPRKIRYSWQTGSAMVLNTYEYPIVAKNMQPARDACENCHKPNLFTSDTLRELKVYATDDSNTLTTLFLLVKTGGGSAREGLGSGIHWHLENPVYYYALDKAEQQIPYVVVTHADGSRTEFVDVEAGFDPASIDQAQLEEMDCITCHNRTSHEMLSPDAMMDDLLGRGLVSSTIPGIKRQGVEILSQTYTSYDEANAAITGLVAYYKANQPAFYGTSSELIDQAVAEIQKTYSQNVFIDQKANWSVQPNNLAHKEAPGCFRCHDGKHLTADKQAVRLECNLCHSIPVVAAGNQLVTNIEVSRGIEPASHLDTNWIALHHSKFDTSCQACHTVADPGGVSNTSFCSNSACHASSWDYAGFDAPALREALGLGTAAMPTPASEAVPTQTAPGATPQALSFTANIQPVLAKCTACHGENGQAGVNLSSYAALMAGGTNGAIVVPGDPSGSLLVSAQSQATPHFMQLTADELQLIIDWIAAGAKE